MKHVLFILRMFKKLPVVLPLCCYSPVFPPLLCLISFYFSYNELWGLLPFIGLFLGDSYLADCLLLLTKENDINQADRKSTKWWVSRLPQHPISFICVPSFSYILVLFINHTGEQYFKEFVYCPSKQSILKCTYLWLSITIYTEENHVSQGQSKPWNHSCHSCFNAEVEDHSLASD